MLVNRVYDLLRQEYSERRRSKAMTASNVTACDRLLWYTVTGRLSSYDSPEPDPQFLNLLEDGNVHQEAFEEQLARLGFSIPKREFGVVALPKLDLPIKELQWKGLYARVDFSTYIDGAEWFIEFKGFNAPNFRTFTQYGLEGFPHYKAQAQIIANGSFLVEDSVLVSPRPTLFIVKCKDTSALAEEIVKPDFEYLNGLLSKKQRFDEYKLLKQEPPRPYEYGSTQCQGCEALRRCWFKEIRAETRIGAYPEVDLLVTKLQALKPYLETYNSIYERLKSEVMKLHDQEKVGSLVSGNWKSTIVNGSREKLDSDRVRELLSKEEWEQVCIETPLKYPRITMMEG